MELVDISWTQGPSNVPRGGSQRRQTRDLFLTAKLWNKAAVDGWLPTQELVS
uniref:Uncharacterized protein n=1 Tax=Peronospora matthiolae TaxID=2874970 RepID=A0AAV1UH92_9STRA